MSNTEAAATSRITYTRLDGAITGQLWSGPVGTLQFGVNISRERRPRGAVVQVLEAALRNAGGDFQERAFDPDTTINVTVVRQKGQRIYEYTRVVFLTQFPSLRHLVKKGH
jgi:hypothetical protein